MTESFFERDGEDFAPTARARGPWGPDTLHGRVVAGLLGHCLEQAYGDESLLFARLTVDLFRMPRVLPVAVETRMIRQGKRIRVAEAEMSQDGAPIARAGSVQLKIAEAPPGNVWRPGSWDAPGPAELRAAERPGEIHMWETRPIGESRFGGPGPARMWIRETHLIVAGEALTPFTRVAVAADIASPLANMGDQGLHYVNADITLYLHRPAIGEWIGWEVSNHESTAGIAIGECRVHDIEGPIGTSSICGVTTGRSAS